MPTVTVRDANVVYEVDGAGANMVLVSGTGGNLRSNWDHLMPRFTQMRRVVRVDYSGAGQTTDSGAPLSVQILAQQVVAAAQAADAEPFDLVGYSLGTCVSIYIAAHYPELVRSMVLIAAFSNGTGTRNRLQTELWQDLIERDPRLFAKAIVFNGMSAKSIEAMDDAQIDVWIDAICNNNDWNGISRQIDLDRRVDVTHLLPEVQAPTLVIGCKHDNVFPFEHARRVAGAIRGAQYVEMDAGHFAPFEEPEVFGDLVVKFVSRTSTPTR